MSDTRIDDGQLRTMAIDRIMRALGCTRLDAIKAAIAYEEALAEHGVFVWPTGR